MRIVFAGSPTVALPTLRALAQSHHQVVGVLSQPPRPVGRKQVLTDTPVATLGRELGLDVATPNSARDVIEALDRWEPEIAIVVAYGRILAEAERNKVPGGWWNVHFSLLPRWRGAAPVPYAIATGDTTTGITVFRIEEGVDTGAIATSVAHPIAAHDTTQTLLGKLADIAPGAVLDVLALAQSNGLNQKDQTGEVTFAPKPGAEVGELRWGRPVDEIYNTLRAWGGEPGCFALREDTSQRVKVVDGWPDPHGPRLSPGSLLSHPEGVLVGTSTDPLLLKRVQPAGKSDMDARDWLRGLPSGVRFRA
jgi:methionyl-tRNA formyltransferase